MKQTVALPVLTKRLIEQKLGGLCDKRLPPHARDEVRLGFSILDLEVTLYEDRVDFKNPDVWIKHDVALFRFDPDTTYWTLHFPDRNGKWHRYDPAKPSRDFEKLVGLVDVDLNAVFWG